MKNAFIYVVIVSLTLSGMVRAESGPQGPKGDKGDRGEQGQNGERGQNGQNGHDGNNGQNGHDGQNGQKGSDGSNGQNGTDGTNGSNGKDGKDGVMPPTPDNLEHRLNVNLGFDVRWYDWKHIALKSGYRFDMNHKGHVVDALVVELKLGKSSEEREMERLRRDIQELKQQAAATFLSLE